MENNITHNITITVTDKMYEDVKMCAEQEGMTVTEWIENAIRHTIED